MGEVLNISYSVTEHNAGEEKVWGIKGTDFSTGESFEIKRAGFDFKTVSELSEKLNRNQVSLSHFYDVVRDTIYEASVLAIG